MRYSNDSVFVQDLTERRIMTKRLNTAQRLSLMLGGIFMASLPMQANSITVVPTTLTFTGTCTDCSGTGVGTLVVTGYVPGNALVLSTSNFVSFNYVSNLLPSFSITSPTFFSGTIPAALPAAFSLNLQGTGGGFMTNSSIPSWCVGVGCGADHGTTFSIAVAGNPTPEPGALSLMILGLGGLGVAGRRRRLSQS
jgi:hypothetical protein